MKNHVSNVLIVLCLLVGATHWGEQPIGAWALSQEVQIEKIEVKNSPNGPVVLLKVGDRAIPIFVDPIVARSIQGALSGGKFSRPLSHELMSSILRSYDIRVQQVFVTLRQGVYYGTLSLLHNGKVQVFDSRSSDAIGLAVHFHSPVFVEQALLDSAGIQWDQEDFEGKRREINFIDVRSQM